MLNGKRIGIVKEYLDGNLIFEGEYRDDCKINGKEFYLNGKIKYEGGYLFGRRSGKGKEYYINGQLEFDGEYAYGKKLYGKTYNSNGQLEFEGFLH